jgi:hypothetical protein
MNLKIYWKTLDWRYRKNLLKSERKFHMLVYHVGRLMFLVITEDHVVDVSKEDMQRIVLILLKAEKISRPWFLLHQNT